jgi:hypothetical protein
MDEMPRVSGTGTPKARAMFAQPTRLRRVL